MRAILPNTGEMGNIWQDGLDLSALLGLVQSYNVNAPGGDLFEMRCKPGYRDGDVDDDRP